jgi:hypothetical protein
MTTDALRVGTSTISALVERERRHVRRAELIAALLFGAGAAALVLGLGAALLGSSRWLVLPRALPFMVWLVLGAALLALAVLTRLRLRKRGTAAQVALAIESEQGMRRGLLVGAIELEGTGALAARAASAARASLPHGAPLAPALRRTSSRRAAFGVGAAAAGMLVLLSATPLFGDGLRAVMRPLDAWRGALLARPRIDGAPDELLRGSPLHLTVRAPGRTKVVLAGRQTGEPWRFDTLAVDSRTDEAHWTLPALRGDLRLVATDGRATSDSVVVHAADRPFVGAVTISVTYPAYLSRPAETLPIGELLRLPRGTMMTIAGRASVPLDQVVLSGGGQDTYALTPSGHTFSGRLVATHPMRLMWRASGPLGAVPDVPPPLEIEILEDAPPQVSIAVPAADTVLAMDDRVGLGLSASDDHGIASVELRITRVASGNEMPAAMQGIAASVGTSWVGGASVNVAALGLLPGDALRVRAEAVDASPWAQRGVSRDLIIKRPTMEERRNSARALGDSAVKEARAAASAQKSLAQRTDEAARAQARQDAGRQKSGQQSGASSSATSAQQKPGMNFESAEKARALAQEQRAMTDRVQKLRDATQNLEQQLKAAGALDSSLARQLAEAQSLLRQALTPEMLAQMQKLENAARQMNGDQSRDALRDLAQMQQRMKEQLERTAEMLKRAAHEGAMQTLGDQARELAARQQALADSAGHGGPDRKAADAREAGKLAEQTERLRQQIESLKDRLSKDGAAAGASRTGEAEQHAAKSETGMRRAANEMQSAGGEKGDRQSGQKQSGEPRGGAGEQRDGTDRAREAAAEMDRASKSMQEARSAQVKEWKQELTQELDQAAQEMMQLARQERALEQQARAGQGQDERRGAQSAVEQGVDKANERLQGAGKKSALLSQRSQRAMGDAKDKVSQATGSVSQPKGNPQQQANALGEAADALTKAAASLARDRERANSANSASGFSEMLQQMQEAAQQQGQINSQSQGLMSMPNGSSSGGGQALARALAQKQRSVADQLEEAGEATGGDKAAQLAREARQLADALDGGRLDAGTLARQQQLFRRLLDAGRSLEKEERDDSGKREAKSATGNEVFTPGDKVDAKAAMKFRPPTWEEMRGLSADERRAILDYFTRLNSAPPSTP